MPPVITAVAIYAAASAVESVVIGAFIGAVIGAISAGIQGGDVKKGALMGAIGGAGTVFLGNLGTGSAGATEGVAGMGTGTLETGKVSAGLADTTGKAATIAAEDIGPNTAFQGVSAGQQVAQQVPAQAGSGGILSKAADWMQAHPKATDILGQTMSGAATAMLNEDSDKRTIEALMERDRLNRDALKVGGLSDIDARSVLPSIGTFMERPKWQMDLQPSGILEKNKTS